MTKCKNFKGLYQPEYEHDACGVGMVVNIHGGKSHELVDNALKVLENMEHRGAETRDKTGDGAGIMVQIPHEFILLQGIPVPEKGKYGTGLVFLPKDEKAQRARRTDADASASCAYQTRSAWCGSTRSGARHQTDFRNWHNR